jgi:hypothetical protein
MLDECGGIGGDGELSDGELKIPAQDSEFLGKSKSPPNEKRVGWGTRLRMTDFFIMTDFFEGGEDEREG